MDNQSKTPSEIMLRFLLQATQFVGFVYACWVLNKSDDCDTKNLASVVICFVIFGMILNTKLKNQMFPLGFEFITSILIIALASLGIDRNIHKTKSFKDMATATLVISLTPAFFVVCMILYRIVQAKKIKQA
jgi:hypothetical protein